LKESLGIIPARAGSKRVPNKNIRLLNGKPLIAYTIEAALKSESLSRLVVSTDSEEISKIAKDYGAEAPFLRPKDLAEDETPDQPVFLHVLEDLKDSESYIPDLVLNLRPTSPLKTGDIIDDVIAELSAKEVDVVRTVSKSEGIYHPYWSFEIDDDGFARELVSGIKIKDYPRSQMLPDAYRINGVVDGMKSKVIYNDSLLRSNFKALIIPEINSIDIDTEFDFRMCEMIMSSNYDSYSEG
jgi:N-acylneuraminate cytidylyltransferase/CMP-N,N'-diacetyllegionaminic acid synthase|tara:strand:- start:2026 stop:2748 length:723 start_codon:yes stop_codon:yes gene_type:complete